MGLKADVKALTTLASPVKSAEAVALKDLHPPPKNIPLLFIEQQIPASGLDLQPTQLSIDLRREHTHTHTSTQFLQSDTALCVFPIKKSNPCGRCGTVDYHALFIARLIIKSFPG